MLRKLTTDTALETWRKDPTDTDVVVYKQLTIEAVDADGVKGDDGSESRRVKFIASTNAADRTNDVIEQTGWRLENFLKNPVSLFGHDYNSLPIGKVVELSPEADRLVATIQFATEEDGNPFAENVFRMVKSGFLKSVSVGFRPLKFAMNEERGGLDFMEQELLELSVVPVPAHQDALVAAGLSDDDVEALRGWATKTLERLDGTQDDEDNAEIEEKILALTVDAVRGLARTPLDPESDTSLYAAVKALPWEDESIGVRASWTAYEKAVKRAARSGELSDEQLSHLLHLVGFEEESELLKAAEMTDAEALRLIDEIATAQAQEIAELKAGRRLSKSTESKLQQAFDLLGDVLNSVKAPAKEDEDEVDAEEDAGPAGGAGVDAPTDNITPDGANPDEQDVGGMVPDNGKALDDDDWTFELEDTNEGDIEVNEQVLADSIGSAARSAVNEVIARAVQDAVRSATGRID